MRTIKGVSYEILACDYEEECVVSGMREVSYPWGLDYKLEIRCAERLLSPERFLQDARTCLQGLFHGSVSSLEQNGDWGE